MNWREKREGQERDKIRLKGKQKLIISVAKQPEIDKTQSKAHTEQSESASNLNLHIIEENGQYIA